MENILSLFCFFLGLFNASAGPFLEGKTLEPLYWNSSNPLFHSDGDGGYKLDASINDKLDIICPSRLASSNNKDELYFFQLFLVSKDDYEDCNTAGGRRLLTCNVPQQEKKYTFFFQEISPSPWGLEFNPDESYYVISTSSGMEGGIDNKKGGVCARFNMKIELTIHRAEGEAPDTGNYPFYNNFADYNDVVEPYKPDNPKNKTVGNDEPPSKNEMSNPTKNDDQLGNRDGLIIGAVLGAFAVLFILLLVYFVYKIYGRHRYNKKFHSPPITPSRSPVDPLDQQVTLLPISHTLCHDPRLQHHGRMNSNRDRLRSATLSTHNEVRSPPCYNESFLENGGTVACV